MPLLICRTCPRYDPDRTGQFGRDLDAALAAHPDAGGLRIRNVQCLGGCTEHGVVAVDGMGKARVRFNGVTVEHLDAITTAARAHQHSPTGAPAEWQVPAQLAEHLSTITYKRTPNPTPGRDGTAATGDQRRSQQ